MGGRAAHRAILAGVALALLCLVAPPAPAAGQEPGDSVSLAVTDLFIGQRATVTIVVRAPAGAIVEIDPAADSWNGVEVVRIRRLDETPAGSETLYRFEVVVAPFLPGPGTFAPAVAIISGGGASLRTLPAVRWNVRSTLPEDAPLELSPLPGPRPIAGAESPLLKPALALGGLAALAAVALAIYLAGQLAIRRLRAKPTPSGPEGPPEPAFEAIEAMLESDPVWAYRALSGAVRSVISGRYGLPATALTTSELRRRMEASGADRFLARLVGGLLEECDAVVYAGYRPAAERRRADLTMAREIVEGAG